MTAGFWMFAFTGYFIAVALIVGFLRVSRATPHIIDRGDDGAMHEILELHIIHADHCTELVDARQLERIAVQAERVLGSDHDVTLIRVEVTK